MLSSSTRRRPIAFAAAVVLVFLVTNALNFAAVAAYLHLTRRSRRP